MRFFAGRHEGLSQEDRASAYRVLSVWLTLFSLVVPNPKDLSLLRESSEVFAHSCLQVVCGSVIYDLARGSQPPPILLIEFQYPPAGGLFSPPSCFYRAANSAAGAGTPTPLPPRSQFWKLSIYR
jgi:hypothetical protein